MRKIVQSVAEGVGFEPTCPEGKRFSRPPRYDHFDNPPYRSNTHYYTTNF